MITLTRGNSYSQVSGLSVAQFKELKKLMSYDIGTQAAYFSGSTHNTQRSLLGKRGEFPSGLYRIAKKYLETLAHTLKDLRKRPTKGPTLFEWKVKITPYEEQVDSARIANQSGCGVITMPTGCGKSVAMACLIHAMQLKTLVVVPNLGLKKQLKETFKRLFGSLNNITVENIDSAALKKEGNYDVLIIDEAHHSAAKTYRTLNKKYWGGIYHRFFYTATPFRSRNEEQLLYESIAGNVIYEVTYQQAVDKGYVLPVEAYYVDVPIKKTDGYTWAQVYKDLVVANKPRNELIARLMAALEASGASTLCLVKEIAHGEALRDLTGAPFANGQDGESAALITDFNSKASSNLIATVGVAGEGVDTKPAEYVLISGLGKSKPNIMQMVGRGMRVFYEKDSCKIILFKDSSHRWTLSHFRAQLKILKDEYGIKAIKLNI